MSTLQNLSPKAVWGYFEELTKIPRPSKHEALVRQYLRDFARSKQLSWQEDGVGNIVIRKAASPGMADRKPIILQAHLDMVPQKNSGTRHDFLQDPIKAYIDGDWVKAQGTTLGADNGIGVALMLAVLADESLQHGALEALFTVDEETGMTGAYGLGKDMLSGDRLINLDTEEEGVLCIGCAGGINITGSMPLKKEDCPPGQFSFSIAVKGLRGGHSGIDINLGRGNANLLICQLLREAGEGLSMRIQRLQGGSLRNAIPREAFAEVVISGEDREKFLTRVEALTLRYCQGYAKTDPDIVVSCNPRETRGEVYPPAVQQALLNTVLATPHGVVAMSKDFPEVVETSNNVAVIRETGDSVELLNLLRSSSEDAKKIICERIASILRISNFEVHTDGDYPGWQPDNDSALLKLCKDQYVACFDREPTIESVHAGLETGLFKKVYPSLDMISFGPNISFPHSPDEKVQISSVARCWQFLTAVLAV